MTISRRRLVQSLALTGASNGLVEGAQPPINVDVIRSASTANGTHLSDDRVSILAPVLNSCLTRLQALRDFEVDDGVAPTHGILDR